MLYQFLKEFGRFFIFYGYVNIFYSSWTTSSFTVYKHLHKLHHRWIVPTPFASHAFHWLDSFLQSSPYHLYAFLFPIT